MPHFVFSVAQLAPPVLPGGVTIKYIEVGGGFLEDSILIRQPAVSDLESASGMGSGSTPPDYKYSLLVANFSVTYVVDDCQYGISLIQGNHTIGDEVQRTWIERTATGTPPVTGTFSLTFNGRTISNIDAQTTGGELQNLLNANFFEEGGKSK